jgi:hypothetical protein
MSKPTYTGPAHPIGYVEVQTSWFRTLTQERKDMLRAELTAKTLRENPGLEETSFRIEARQDGQGRWVENVYIGFAPKTASSEPLDPHNLNAAPARQDGWPEPTDGILPLGSREQKF